MKILLLGEYSRLHNSLKEGLVALQHEVVLLGDGDGFKGYPVDLSIKPVVAEHFFFSFFRKALFKLFKHDIAEIERGIRSLFHLNKLKGFDVVQLINERPIKTVWFIELFILRKIFKNNKKVFLLSCGADTFSVRYMLNNRSQYSILTPYFENKSLKNHFNYLFKYIKPRQQRVHKFVEGNVQGIIASDFDYVMPLHNHPNFLQIIPNPIIIAEEERPAKEHISYPIVLFLGVNSGNYFAKGVSFFEKAISILEQKFSKEKLEIRIVANKPYEEYKRMLQEADIVYDQVYSHDQGYNALEAMGNGKVVFTGAEKLFLKYYNLKEDQVCINALPDVDYLVNKTSFLLNNIDEILKISENARKFIRDHHTSTKIAKEYLKVYALN